MTHLPPYVKVCLWSYDTDALDLARDKQRIIFNVLNHGGEKAAQWIFDTYSEHEITEVITHSNVSEWSKKSLSLWSLIFNTHPSRKTRFA